MTESSRPDQNDLYYLYVSDTPTQGVRRTYARANSKERVLQLVYENLPTAIVHRIGIVTDVEEEKEETNKTEETETLKE
jgi:hypothetical protein